MTQTNITIKEDLTDVKIANRKKQILNVILKWRTQLKKEHNNFKKEFLDNKYNPYFDALKDLIGDFKEIPEISVLVFLFRVICEKNSEYPIIKELQEEIIKQTNNL